MRPCQPALASRARIMALGLVIYGVAHLSLSATTLQDAGARAGTITVSPESVVRASAKAAVVTFDLSGVPAGAVIADATLERGPESWTITEMARSWLADPRANAGVLLDDDAAQPVLRLEWVIPERMQIIAPEPAGGGGLTFDLSRLPRDAVIHDATLRRSLDDPRQEMTKEVQEWLADPAAHFGVVPDDDPAGDRPALVVAYSVASTTQKLAPRADTFLNVDKKNYNGERRLNTYTWPNKRIANVILMQFDLSSVPKGATINEALLYLALVESDAQSEKTYAVTAHRILRKRPSLAAATGYTSDGVTAWTPNNCCHQNIPMAQGDISSAYDTRAIDKTRGYKVWTLTRMAREWVADPATNLGVALNADASMPADRWRFFASNDEPDANLRPYLRITYTTGADTTAPVISAVASSAISASGATIIWTTDETSNSQVEYGLTTAYGSTTPIDFAYVTAHSVKLTGLTDGKRYEYRVRSRDAAGNMATSGSLAFTTRDGTPPTIAVTSPAASATVSGTITPTATASDNVGVLGVQFKVDGVNLGGEDASAPYSASWNTSAASNGSHLVTAVARDAAGNYATSAPVTVTVSNVVAPPPAPASGIAAKYPGDAGIAAHPDVVFTEMFEEATIADLTARYDDVNHSAGMSFVSGVPSGSGGSRSLQLTTNGTSNEAAGLYKTLPDGQVWYVRYYINYTSPATYGHSSVWMGGYNPRLSYPNPQAGVKPSGNDRFSTGVEPHGTENERWFSYTYWKDMRLAGDGKYWGNVFFPADTTLRMSRNRWYCVEAMVKLNSPATDSNGEFAMWVDGQRVLHMGKGFPNGSWSNGVFTESAGGSPFGGFQWRSDAALNLNWVWLQNYVTGTPSSLQYDHLVVAKSYIGCLTPAASSADTTAPTVSLIAPVAAATVSGSAVAVAANASDNVGVTGVQFKLNGANLGAEDTTAPYSVAWDSTKTANGAHALTAVARDAAGNTRTSSGVSVNVSNVAVPIASPWPNEPAGFTLVTDQPWNGLSDNGWNYLIRTASKPSDIVVDAAAPLSPANEMRMIFTPDMSRDSEPGVHWVGLPSAPTEVYSGWWMKTSPNWTCSPAGCGKITFLFPDESNGGGITYSNLAGVTGSHYVNIATTWAQTGYKFWEPNVTKTPVADNQWYRVEWYMKWESSPGASDGVIRWWVNGQLNGDYNNVPFPTVRRGFIEYQHAPTRQNTPPSEEYLYIDHTRVSHR